MFDNEVFDLIESEKNRQIETINLTASENYVSEEVMRALGSVLTNKYAEGVPGHRFYSGCDTVDSLEILAIERLTALFKAESANVQPYSGTQANMAVYFAALTPGDTVLSMTLKDGGHLSHGSLVSFSGEYYNFVHYGVNEEGVIDYEDVERLAKLHKPRMIVCGTSSYSRAVDFERLREIADTVESFLLVDMAHVAGLVAAGFYQNPVPFADFVTGTTQKTLRGPRGGFILTKSRYENAINKSIFPGIQGGPLENVIAAKAVCFKEAMTEEFKSYISNVLKNAKAMSDEFIGLGFDVVSGGTDTHLFVLDLTRLGVTGIKFQEMLEEVGVDANRQVIPGDKLGADVTSGVRIGTSAITTRGFGVSECKRLATLISLLRDDFLKNKAYVREQIARLISKFPIYNNVSYV